MTNPKNDLDFDYLSRIFRYDRETGKLFRLVGTDHITKTEDREVGWNVGGYLSVKAHGRCLLVHRIAWILETHDFPKGVIDHMDGNRKNNRFENLRDVSRNVNCQNQRGPRKDNKCGYLGVTPSRKKWMATIRIDGKNKILGYSYKTPEEAHQAYLEAKRKFHEGCTI